MFIDDGIERMADDALCSAAECKQSECVIEIGFPVGLIGKRSTTCRRVKSQPARFVG